MMMGKGNFYGIFTLSLFFGMQRSGAMKRSSIKDRKRGYSLSYRCSTGRLLPVVVVVVVRVI